MLISKFRTLIRNQVQGRRELKTKTINAAKAGCISFQAFNEIVEIIPANSPLSQLTDKRNCSSGDASQ